MGTIITRDGVFTDTVEVGGDLIDGLSQSLMDGEFTDDEVILTRKIHAALQSLQSQFTNTQTNPGTPVGPNTGGLTIQQIRNMLGSMASQNRNAVNITGGTISGVDLTDSEVALKSLEIAGETLKLFDNTSTLRTRDVLICDTAEDDDFGAWTDRTQYATWHTATRGSFPRIAAIVAHDNGLRIHDASAPGFPSWLSLSTTATTGFLGSAITPTALSMRNGVLAMGSTGGLLIFDFLEDRVYRFSPGKSVYAGTIGGVANGSAGAPEPIAGETITQNGVHTVQVFAAEGAPLHPVTKTPRASVLVGNGGHALIIGPDRTVSALQGDRAGHVVHSAVRNERGDFYTLKTSSGDELEVIRAADADGQAASLVYASGLRPQFLPNSTRTYWDVQATRSGAVFGPSTRNEIVFLEDGGTSSVHDGMGVGITGTYLSGWLPSGTILATLNGTSEPDDTSGSGLDLTEAGSVPQAAVATSADLQHYGPFSAANYLSRTNLGASVAFGAGDFSIMAWIRTSGSSASETVLTYGQRNNANTSWTGAYLDLTIESDGSPRLISETAAGTSRNLTAATDVNDGAAHLLVLRRSGNVLSLSVDGAEATLDMADGDTYRNDAGDLTIGRHPAGTGRPLASGRLSLFRLMIRAVTDTQLSRIYQDERLLFHPGAACLPAGSLRSLRHDILSGRTAVATTQGIYVYQGLRIVQAYDSTHALLTESSAQAAYATRTHLLMSTAGETVAIRETDSFASALRRFLAVVTEKEEGLERRVMEIQGTLISSLRSSILGEDQIRNLTSNYLRKGSNILFVDDATAGTRTIVGPAVTVSGSNPIIDVSYDAQANVFDLTVDSTNLIERVKNSLGGLIRGDAGSGIRVTQNAQGEQVIATFGLEPGASGNIRISTLGENTANTYTISGPSISTGQVASSFLTQSYDRDQNRIGLAGAGITGTRIGVEHDAATNTWELTGPTFDTPNFSYLRSAYDQATGVVGIQGPSLRSPDQSILINVSGQNRAFSEIRANPSLFGWTIYGPQILSSDGSVGVVATRNIALNRNQVDLSAKAFQDMAFRAGYSPLSGEPVSLVRGEIGSVIVPRNGRVQDVLMRLREAPSGTSSNRVTIDILKNNASIFSSGSARLHTTGTGLVRVTTQGSSSFSTAGQNLSAGDILTVQVVQTGSTLRGAGLDLAIAVSST